MTFTLGNIPVEPPTPSSSAAISLAEAPTNPLFTDTSINNDERIFTAIAADGANTFTTEVFTGTTQYSNLNTTKGFRIKCYDALTTDGIQFNPAAFATHYYFVLVYSDTDTRHHFARITEILTEDSEGDAFEFEPKLGNEIPKDTKFMIFKGHVKTNNNILAFSAGILNNTSSLTLEDKLSCARPLFYFFNELLDKNNELDHDTKYYAMQKHGSISTTSHTFDTTNAITFRTVQDFGKVVIDYSKFTHRVTLTDKLRDLDNTITEGDSITINEGGTLTADNSDYNEMFPNAKRIGDDEKNSPAYTGPKRYLHYDFSPTKSNLLYNVYDHTNTESIDGKGGFAETSIIDNGRIMPRKVKEFDAYRVRHNIHRGDMNEFFALAATYSSKTSNAVFSFNTEYNLNTVLNAGDEVKLGDNILIVQSFGSLSGTTQEITFQSSTHPYVRTENDASFTAQSTTPTSGDVLHRRAYNATDGTLMLDISLLNGRFSKMYVAFTSLNHNERFATITACDATKGMITLSFDTDSYNTNPLSFAKGQYQIFIERFNGEVENIENKKENGQTIMEIQGRDKFNKLLSPVVNLNTLFSEDIIYSSNSPYNKLQSAVPAGSVLASSVGSTFIKTEMIAEGFDSPLVEGDKIFVENGFLGEITSFTDYSGGGSSVLQQINITTGLLTSVSAGDKIYKESEKNYILSKALGSSHLATNKPSSLTGAANKGLIFTSGNKITMSSGAESDSLVSSSANASAGAIGYAIHKPSSISNDFAFQSKLHDEHKIIQTCSASSSSTTMTVEDSSKLSKGLRVNGTNVASGTTIASVDSRTQITLDTSTTGTISSGSITFDSPPSTFDTVNTLIDFEVVSTSKKDNIAEIELAPYIPITLGRKTNYFTETSDFTFTEVGTVSAVDSSTNDTFFDIANSNAYSLEIGDAIFVGANKTFVGLVFDKLVKTTSSALVRIYLDRTIHNFSVSETIHKIDKPVSDLLLVNGFHLWGGKILTRPHPKLTSTGAVPLNLESTTIAGDNTSRFGQPYYKTREVSFGNFTLNLPIIKKSNSRFPTFYPRKSQINFYASSYRFKPNIGSSNTINANKTDSSYRVLPPDERGYHSPFGSNLNNTRIFTSSNESINFYYAVSGGFGTLEKYARYIHIDESAARLFLYVNSDILPYSSLRKDSLLHSTGGNMSKTLNNYNLFLIDNKNVGDSKVESGERKLLKDEKFQTLSFSGETDLSKLKRFGLMRLTEVCVDFLFNPVNPEKEILKRVPESLASVLSLTGSSITTIGNIASISGTTINFTTSVTINDTTNIFDEKGQFIGTKSGTSTGTAHTLTSAGILTNNGSAASNAIVITGLTGTFLKGRNEKDSFHQMDRFKFHPLKCCVIPGTSGYGSDATTGSNPADAAAVANDTGSGATALSIPSDTEIVLPIAFESGNFSTLSASADTFPIRPLGHYFSNIHGRPYNGLIGVALDRFGIEDAGAFELVEGNTTQILKGVGEITVNADEHLILKSDAHFKGFEYVGDTSTSYTTSRPYTADGAMMVFKPRLFLQTTSPANFTTGTIASSNGNLHKNVIDVATSDEHNCFLKFIDLTGCYLVPEAGRDIIGTSVSTGTKDLAKSMQEVRVSQLIHVVSHEVNNGDIDEHHLITDRALAAGAYRILQPNETCFYDFMPKELHLNTLKSKYTKKANKNEVYIDEKESYFYKDGNDKSGDNSYRDEGVLSMFVAIDLDKQSDDTGIVIEDSAEFPDILPEGEYSLYYTDGENSKRIQTSSKTIRSTLHSIVLNEMFNAKGVVSVSETFTVSSNEQLKIDPTRACIGSTVSVGLEGEDIINELLEQEGIEFTTTSTDTPMYLAPNYQGVDLYSAIRYILDRKEMKLVEENNVFKIFPESENSLRTNITINDSGEFLISEFDKVSTLFDFFNEINVYGNAHKAIRKDLRSIQKRGRKTLEVVDNTLLTQEEVDKRATKLLLIHSRLNQKLSFTMQNKGINQLRVGDIVNVSIPRENIEMNEFIVLEMEHQLTGFIKLELGRYSKDLSDVFSELLISSKETKAALRSANLQSNEISYNFLNTLNTKELKLLVRKRSAGGAGRTLGFGTALGFTTPLGFTGGAITITDLVEEDLA